MTNRISFEKKLWFVTQKRYFDTGFGILNYLKYLIILFGISSLDLKSTLIMGFAFGVGCYLIGFLWLKTDFYTAETEVSNRYNLFVEEMRGKIDGKNKKD